ncbi:MAG: hypothetical protein K9K30_01370 [Burkholderiaceae bacterium]|nr:hypothetical protein [Sulfuritalea sp.]MCF8173878.1 hypothetical protein [Burkholderiaceae bacterium]MCF8184546.1 hypothetical protein [Polynucleobacter sp.]
MVAVSVNHTTLIVAYFDTLMSIGERLSVNISDDDSGHLRTVVRAIILSLIPFSSTMTTPRFQNDVFFQYSLCACRALASALDPESMPGIDLADLRMVMFPGAQCLVVPSLNPQGRTTEAWHRSILQGLETARRTSSIGSHPPDAMLLCGDRRYFTTRELANAVTAMRRIAPEAAIYATRGDWDKGGSTGDDLSCLFATWKTESQGPHSSRRSVVCRNIAGHRA